MDDVKIRELPHKSKLSSSDLVVIETNDGTQVANVNTFKSLLDTATVFETLYDMREADLEEGLTCITLGYRTRGDGGAAQYIITYNPTLKPNGYDVIKLNTSDTLRAVFISLTGTVTPEQFGAKGDGSKDDSIAIQACIDSGLHVLFKPNAKYCIHTPLELKSNTYLDLNGCTLLPVVCDVFTLKSSQSEAALISNLSESDIIGNIHITNFTVDIRDGLSAIKFCNRVLSNIIIDNFRILNTNRHAIEVSIVNQLAVKNGYISGNPEFNTSIIYSDISFLGDEVPSANMSMTSIVIDNIHAKNIGTIVQSEKASDSADVIDNIRIRDINYYSDTLLANSCIFKSLGGNNTNVTISDIYAKNISYIADSIAHGVCNISNIQGTNVSSILSHIASLETNDMVYNIADTINITTS